MGENGLEKFESGRGQLGIEVYNLVAKPKNEDHVSCFADSHLAWGGGEFEFFQVKEPI